VPKPGQPGKLRPITIPPFMDRVVQETIRRVLESVYEPRFERRNRSFAFRPLPCSFGTTEGTGSKGKERNGF
jgi:retron-type reverse transcriptase